MQYSSGQKIGKFTVIDCLGSGHFGTVYKVHDAALSRVIAIKLIPTANAEIWKNLIEAQAQHLCQHDNCVRVMSADVVDLDNTLTVIIEMEYIAAGSLLSKMQKTFLSCRESVNHIRQILFALEHAHSKGVLHRDVKPGNILLGKPHTKLSDFGIAVDLSRPSVGYSLNYRPHASPQIAAGAAPGRVDDVFAAGMTLFRLLNNYSDWSNVCGQVVDWQQCVKRGTLVKDIGFQAVVPRKLANIVRKACHPDVSKRYGSCTEFRQALDKLKFRFPWVLAKNGKWQADSEEIAITNNMVVYRTNGRRKTGNCRKFNSKREAEQFVAGLVAETTLD